MVEPFGQGVAEKQDPVRLTFNIRIDLFEAGTGMAVLPRRWRGQLALHEGAAAQRCLRLGRGRVAAQQNGQQERDNNLGAFLHPSTLSNIIAKSPCRR